MFWTVAVLVLMGAGFSGVWRPTPTKDFSLFYDAGRQWLERGEPGGLAWYHPFALRCFSVLGLVAPWTAGTAWVIANTTCAAGATWIVGGWHDDQPRSWLRTEAIPSLALFMAWCVLFTVNQFAAPILLLLVATGWLLERERDGCAGVCVGLATLLKLSPLLLLGWLVLARRWRAVVAAITVVVLLGPGLDLVTAGFDRGLLWQVEWLNRVRWSGSAWTVLVAGSQCEYSNHAVPAVLRRLLHPTDSTPYFDVEVGGQVSELGAASVNLVDLPIPVVTAWWAVAMALGVVGLFAACAPPWRRLDRDRMRWELSLFCWGMLWFLPVVRQYHYVWVYPLVSLLVAEVKTGLRHGLRSTRSRAAAIGMATWCVATLASAPRLAQELGVPLLGLLSLGVAGIVVVRCRWPGWLQARAEAS